MSGRLWGEFGTLGLGGQGDAWLWDPSVDSGPNLAGAWIVWKELLLKLVILCQYNSQIHSCQEVKPRRISHDPFFATKLEGVVTSWLGNHIFKSRERTSPPAFADIHKTRRVRTIRTPKLFPHAKTIRTNQTERSRATWYRVAQKELQALHFVQPFSYHKTLPYYITYPVFQYLVTSIQLCFLP
jgi:hypothetical protein